MCFKCVGVVSEKILRLEPNEKVFVWIETTNLSSQIRQQVVM